MKHRCKFPHMHKLSMILQLQCIFTSNTTTEELEEFVDLSLIQGCIKRDLGKLELRAGSERGPGLGGVPRRRASMLRIIFVIIFKFDDLWSFLCMWVVFSSDGVKPWLSRLFSHVGGRLWGEVAVGRWPGGC